MFGATADSRCWSNALPNTRRLATMGVRNAKSQDAVSKASSHVVFVRFHALLTEQEACLHEREAEAEQLPAPRRLRRRNRFGTTYPSSVSDLRSATDRRPFGASPFSPGDYSGRRMARKRGQPTEGTAVIERYPLPDLLNVGVNHPAFGSSSCTDWLRRRVSNPRPGG